MQDGIGILVIIICVILSAYFSATETAFNSVNRVKLKNLEDKGNKKASLVLRILRKYEKMLSTILIGNNVVNILATSVATVICVKHYGEDAGSAISTVVITIVVLIFGEISPKTIAKGSAESLSMFSAPFLRVLMIIFTPLTFIFGLWQKLVNHIFKPKDDNSVTDEEILTIVKTAEEEGEIDNQESALIHNSIDFNETLAEDILTPRVDIEAVEKNCTADDVSRVFADTGYSRIPVYEKDVDHIIGVLYQKDFYNKIIREGGEVLSIMRPVIFTTEHKPIGELFRELQQKKIHMAVVLDEYGGTLGIVTMEDILEELVGEIWDEHEEVEPEIEKISDREYLVSGSANLEKVYDRLGLEYRDDATEALTVSGWLVDENDEMPKAGDRLVIDGLKVTVLDVEDHHVEQVKIQLPEEEESADGEKGPDKEKDRDKKKEENKEDKEKEKDKDKDKDKDTETDEGREKDEDKEKEKE